MAGLVDYEVSSGDEDEAAAAAAPAFSMQIVAAPAVAPTGALMLPHALDVNTKMVMYNPKAKDLYQAPVGPQNPDAFAQKKTLKNTFTGYVEEGDISDFVFEDQRRTFQNQGYAMDPSVNETMANRIIGDHKRAQQNAGETMATLKHRPEKRKREKRGKAEDIEGFKGPWAKYEEEPLFQNPQPQQTETPSLWERKDVDEPASKKQKTEKSTLHIPDAYDYQGRSYLHAPQDLGIKYGEPPSRCFLPKKLLHTWTGHTKGVSAIRFFPKTAHLLLSAGMDSKVKLWEVYGARRLVRTFAGHGQAVRDVCFSNDGSQFLSASYDRTVGLWDAETGECIRKFSNKKVPYCVKFHPSDNKQNLFVCGTSDKKIICYDTRDGNVVQEYDRHLGAVNSITFVEDGRKMVTTSDDKSIRVWEWNIPVDIKYIADPGMHSMPAAALHPSTKFVVFQGLDNNIYTYHARDRFRELKKKVFRGHLVAGYACQPCFSPDGVYLLSGDSEGRVFIWDWKTTKVYSKFKAHDSVCIGVEWNPNETSKVATCGWDGAIKYWD